jgi:ribonucleoside-diphosphate reductase alpha chain
MTVPPVGSGSIVAGTSSGIEPVFAFSYKRRTKSLSQAEFEVKQPILLEYQKAEGDIDNLPDYFVSSHQIKPEFRVRMQATIQKHVDQSLSSTVNLPQNISVDEVAKIYMLAWKLKCKGITCYREGSREGILETHDVKKEEERKEDPKMDEEGDFERPLVLTGKTIKLKMTQGSLYVTLNSNGSPKEVFVTLGKHGSDTKSDAEAIGRLISLYLQSGGTVEDVVTSLKGIQAGQISWDRGMKLLSIPDAIAKALGLLVGPNEQSVEKPILGTDYLPVANTQVIAKLERCPECKEEDALKKEGGCEVCTNCAYSKCG